MQAHTGYLSKPSSAPTTSGLLQPKSHCGQNCACSSCSGKINDSTGREFRAAASSAAAASTMGARFGHDFSRVRVRADAFSPAHHLTIKGQLQAAESASEGTSKTSAESGEETIPGPSESPIETGGPNCPITAVFSSTLAGQEKSSCQLAQNQFGAATLARFVLHGVQSGAGSSSVTEQFKSLKDNYGVFGLLTPNTYTTSGNIFDDCYILASTKPLPSDLELEVEQNHLLNGQIISKNIITYTPGRVSIRSCKRQAGSCDFATVCRR